jgi:alcohol dehydrogenase class IV
MLPRLALIDPELTYDLPPSLTASTGLDALTQLIEPYVSRRANPMADAFCREGLHLAARSLRRAYENGRDKDAREDMSLASLFGGLALANAGLGAVHGFAGPIGGMFPAPHGAICARLLPHVMAANVSALTKRESQSDLLRRYDEIGRILCGDQKCRANDAVAWTQEICNSLRIPPLSQYGLARSDFPEVIQKAAVASSMKANPVELSADEIQEILARAL